MRISAALLLVPFIGGCDLFSAETKLDNVCMELDNRSIDGTPAGKLVRTFTYDDLAIFDGFISLDATIDDLSVTMKGMTGVSDLSFLDTIHISIASQDLPPLAIITCDDGACASDTKETTIDLVPPANLMAYALGGKMTVSVTVEGPLPKESWTANVKICLSGSAKLSIL